MESCVNGKIKPGEFRYLMRNLQRIFLMLQPAQGSALLCIRPFALTYYRKVDIGTLKLFRAQIGNRYQDDEKRFL